MPKNTEWDELTYNGTVIPIKIHYERRGSVRTSFGKENIIVRMPLFYKGVLGEKNLAKAKEWALQTLTKKPDLLLRYSSNIYGNGDLITLLENQYLIHIEEASRKTGKATMTEEVIHLTLPSTLDKREKSKMTSTLLSRIAASKFLYYIENRVSYFNNHFFNESINKISLKYNYSNWGSCSSKRNLNFSTRLLLTPKWIIDYLIVHEMSHLKEMNHSHKFWSIVESVYPKYRDAEKWLRTNGHKCYF